MTYSQMIAVVEKYMTQNPETWHYDMAIWRVTFGPLCLERAESRPRSDARRAHQREAGDRRGGQAMTGQLVLAALAPLLIVTIEAAAGPVVVIYCFQDSSCGPYVRSQSGVQLHARDTVTVWTRGFTSAQCGASKNLSRR